MTAAPSPPSTWTLGLVGRALGVGCFAVAVGAGVGYLISHERPPRSGKDARSAEASASGAPNRPPPAGREELALLAPLKEGGALAGFVVTEIDAVGSAGLLRVVCRKEGVVITLDVALRAEGGPTPPAAAGRYAVFYSGGGAPSDAEGLAVALAAILQTNASAPVPRGMAAFVPRGR
jgi:hypothetical protein